MTTFNTAGRIGKAVGERYGNRTLYRERWGWTEVEALKAGREKIAENLMRCFFDAPHADSKVLRQLLASTGRQDYDAYCHLYSRADREMVKAYWRAQ